MSQKILILFSPALKLKILCVPVESMVNSIKS